MRGASTAASWRAQWARTRMTSPNDAMAAYTTLTGTTRGEAGHLTIGRSWRATDCCGRVAKARTTCPTLNPDLSTADATPKGSACIGAALKAVGARFHVESSEADLKEGHTQAPLRRLATVVASGRHGSAVFGAGANHLPRRCGHHDASRTKVSWKRLLCTRFSGGDPNGPLRWWAPRSTASRSGW